MSGVVYRPRDARCVVSSKTQTAIHNSISGSQSIHKAVCVSQTAFYHPQLTHCLRFRSHLGEKLCQSSKQNINKHIHSIYDDHERDELATIYQELTVQLEGNREVPRTFALYKLDVVLSPVGRKLLENAGKISHNKATEKAKLEYQKYRAKALNNVENDYLKTIAELEKQAKAKKRKEGTEP